MNRIIQMNNPTLCKVSPLGYSFCARSHTGFFLGGYYVMWTTYLEGLLDKKKKNNPQIREKIIIYTKIEAGQSDLETIKWALIKTIISG